jgi:hypothetical protein
MIHIDSEVLTALSIVWLIVAISYVWHYFYLRNLKKNNPTIEDIESKAYYQYPDFLVYTLLLFMAVAAIVWTGYKLIMLLQ